MTIPILSDEEKEKQERFMALYKPCHVRFGRFCRAVCRSNSDAQDLLSESVLQAFERFDSLRQPEAFLHFLFGIAVRLHRRSLRRFKFWGRYSESAAAELRDHSQNPEESADLKLLFDAMQKLPAAQREALALYEISGLSQKEIQEIQGGSLSAVKLRIMRGRQKLARIMGVPDPETAIAMPDAEPGQGNLQTTTL